MGVMDAVKICLTEKFATFSGRASKSEFWWFMLVVWIVNTLVGKMATPAIGEAPSYLMMGISFVVSLVLLIPSLAVLVRRLHDIGKSGSMAWLVIIPIVNFYLLYLCTKSSVEGANQYGESPLA